MIVAALRNQRVSEFGTRIFANKSIFSADLQLKGWISVGTKF